MPKISKLLVEYREVIKDIKFDVTEQKAPKFLINRFVRIITDSVTDPRYENMCTYPLASILVSAFFAIMCNAETWGEIADYTKYNVKFLRKYVTFSDATPIDDTYRRVFSLLNTAELANATKKYILTIFNKIKRAINSYKENHNLPIEKEQYKLINIDGKVCRGSGRDYNPVTMHKNIPNIEILNGFDASDGISIFSIPIDNKTNEIPVAQDVIKTLNLKGCIVTLDALHAQHKTFEAITKSKGDYVITLKSNQNSAFEEIGLLATDEYLQTLKKNKKAYVKEEVGKEYFMIPFSHFAIEKGVTSDGCEKWIAARNIIFYRKTNQDTGEVITLHFVTSLNDLPTAIEAIQGRWDVENLLHRFLDMSFNEDDNKTMDRKAITNLSIMFKLCLSFIKLAKEVLKISVRRTKKSMGWNTLTTLYSVLAVLDLEEITKQLENVKIESK